MEGEKIEKNGKKKLQKIKISTNLGFNKCRFWNFRFCKFIGEKKLKKNWKKNKTFFKSKNAFSSLFVLSISRVWPFCWFKNSILPCKNKTWPPNFQNLENFQFFFKKNHNSSTKIGHTFDEQNVKIELFSKILISSFTLRFWSKMKIYSKIIGSTLSIFFIFFIIRTGKEPYQGRKKVVKNRKIGLIFFEKKDKNWLKNNSKNVNFFQFQIRI